MFGKILSKCKAVEVAFRKLHKMLEKNVGLALFIFFQCLSLSFSPTELIFIISTTFYNCNTLKSVTNFSENFT